jgi:biotin transport system permease protein/energy-coupling factor transport system permease protein
MASLGHYIPGPSFLHRVDPRVKIFSIIALSVVILNRGIFGLSLLSGMLFLTGMLSRLPLRSFYEALKPAALFILFLFMLHLLFTDGRPVPPFPIRGIHITYEGLSGGLQIAWRLALLLAWAATLTMTTAPSEMIGGIERILRPFRFLGVPSHELALMVSMAVRFVPVLREEIHRVRTAQLARGADLASAPLRDRAGAVSRLMWPVMTGTMRRADRLAAAIEARGYSGGPRTFLREIRMTTADYKAMAVTACVVAATWAWT